MTRFDALERFVDRIRNAEGPLRRLDKANPVTLALDELDSAAETPLAFHPMEILEDELAERCWSIRDLATSMSGGDEKKAELLELTILLWGARDKEAFMDAETCALIGKALGTSAEFWINLDRAWRASQEPCGKLHSGYDAPNAQEKPIGETS